MAEIAKISLKSAFPNPEFVKKSDEVFKELALYLARHSDALRRVDESQLETELEKKKLTNDRFFVERTLDFLQSKELQNLMQTYGMLKGLYENAQQNFHDSSVREFDLREKYEALQTHLQAYFSSLETLKTLTKK